MKPVIILCSRRESSRIPDKAFKSVAGVPAIDHILSRLRGVKIPVVVACPPYQIPLYQPHAKKYGAQIFGGNPDSPLHRIAEYLSENPTYTHVVRVTNDDIIIDAKTIKEMLAVAKAKPEVGYISCPNIVDGAGVEIMCRENLIHAAENNGHTEFISYFVKGVGLPKPETYEHICRTTIDRPYRLTMDYIEDWQVLNTILTHCGKNATTDKICSFIDHHPEIMNINSMPLVTFYTCAKNAEKTIGKTIASVLSTGIERMEYIVVDDGSKDNTIAEIAKFSRDKRMRLIVNESNRGLASSSNIAVAQSRGKFIMRVDADDMLMPDMFSHAFHSMTNAINCGAVAVYPAYYEIGKSGRTESVQGAVNHHAGCALMKKSVLNEMRFRDGLRHWDGLELYKRLSKKDGAIAYYLNPIWFYRISDKSMSNTNKDTRARMLIDLGLTGIKVGRA